MRKISILGSTGSVGQSTVKVLKAQEEEFDIQVLTANNNVELLAQQAIELKANHAVIADEKHLAALEEKLKGTGIQVSGGAAAVTEAAAQPADWIMAAIVGMAGLKPLMAAIEQGTTVAIANKEPLVAAGPLVLAAAAQAGSTLLPIDSEHNAIFQVFEKDNREAIERVILTASGGPFREASLEDMAGAKPDEALAHPNWDMGAKISIDSATMMNKALEVIEAHYLFDLAPEKIEVLIHPQSVVHSMVEYQDGSILAQMGAADMCTPITNALGWPQRFKTPGQKLNINTLKQLNFYQVDDERFPFVKLAYESLAQGLHKTIAMNAANEMAVDAFLRHKIAFLDIYTIVKQITENISAATLKTLDDILQYDSFVRSETESCILTKTETSRVAL
jgi:1-deoxy-D-xylulose-5-phosphate reductoisomerase